MSRKARVACLIVGPLMVIASVVWGIALWNDPSLACPPPIFGCGPVAEGIMWRLPWDWMTIGVILSFGFLAFGLACAAPKEHRKHFVKEKTLMLCDGNNGEHAPHWTEWGTYEDGHPVYECDAEWKRISTDS